MTWKDAIIKSLEDMDSHIGTPKEIYDNIVRKQYDVSDKGKTPEATVHAQLGDFIRKGDSRIKRIKNEGNKYCYYLTEYEDKVESFPTLIEHPHKQDKTAYLERDLHPFLCSFFKNKQVFTKTIFHEQSKKKSEEHLKWMHPDIVGVRFVEYGDDVCQQLFKVTSRTNAVDIYSYELKREINSDYELKKCFFQAVSNSSWANYGFLVAFEIGDNLLDEVERLGSSFGIGVILLNANPYKSKIIVPSKRRDVDFKTMNKLCKANASFKDFFAQVEKVLTADQKYLPDIMKGLKDLCDKPFADEAEIEAYCKQMHIPTDEQETETSGI